MQCGSRAGCHPSMAKDTKMNQTLAQSPVGEADMQTHVREYINHEREKLLPPRAREGFRGVATPKGALKGRGVRLTRRQKEGGECGGSRLVFVNKVSLD